MSTKEQMKEMIKKRALMIENLFRCVIIPIGSDIKQYNFLIYIIESDEGQILCINDVKNNFCSGILPKIKHLLINCHIKNQI